MAGQNNRYLEEIHSASRLIQEQEEFRPSQEQLAACSSTGLHFEVYNDGRSPHQQKSFYTYNQENRRIQISLVFWLVSLRVKFQMKRAKGC